MEEKTRGSTACDSSLDLVENAKLSVAAFGAAEQSVRATRAAQREALFALPDTH